jgi:hypothetical protein
VWVCEDVWMSDDDIEVAGIIEPMVSHCVVQASR